MNLEPHHARNVDRCALIVRLEPVPGDDGLDAIRPVGSERTDVDDRVPGAGERREKPRQTTPILGAARASRSEFAEVFVDEVVRYQRGDGIRITGSERVEVAPNDIHSSSHLHDGNGQRLWSNVSVADQDDDISPWERDDWTSDADAPQLDALTRPDRSRAPSTPLAPEFGPGDSPPPTDGPTRTQVLLAGAVGIGLVVFGAVAMLRSGDSADPTTTIDTSVDTSTTSTTAPGSTTTNVVTTTVAPADAITGVVPAAAVVGEVPTWTESLIAVPSPLDALTVPTELVTLTDNQVLQRIEFPSGRVRSLDVAAWGDNLRIAVSDDSIAVYDSQYVAIIRGDEAIRLFEISDGVIFIEAWPATDSFIVTSTGSPAEEAERFVMSTEDGSLQPVTAEVADALLFGAGNFMSNGDLLVNRPGGVYAIGPDQLARRISDGDLLAVGRNHYAIESCDESLSCEQVIVEVFSGAQSAAMLATLTERGFVDPSTRIAPDGRSIVATDATPDSRYRQIIDTATGAPTSVGRLSALYYPDSWAADGSGLFVEEGGAVRFHVPGSAAAATIDGIGVTESLLVRPVVNPNA